MLNSRKTYYSIREVCELTKLEPHVLRYWETEFPQLKPKKNRAGNRAYREKDITIILVIKNLLYKEQYTIPGAKKKLPQIVSQIKEEELSFGTEEGGEPSEERKRVKDIVSELHSILYSLENTL